MIPRVVRQGITGFYQIVRVTLDELCKEVTISDLPVDGKVKERQISGWKSDRLEFMLLFAIIRTSSLGASKVLNLRRLPILGGVRQELRCNFTCPAGRELYKKGGRTAAYIHDILHSLGLAVSHWDFNRPTWCPIFVEGSAISEKQHKPNKPKSEQNTQRNRHRSKDSSVGAGNLSTVKVPFRPPCFH